MPWSFWSGVLVLLLPSFSSLSSMARKLIKLSELYHASCSLTWQLPRFGLKISFKKASGSSSYSSITTSSRGLLFTFMEFLSSSLVAEVSFQKNVLRRGPPLLSMKQCGTASKTCEKHGHSAMLQRSHSLLFAPFKELFSRQ